MYVNRSSPDNPDSRLWLSRLRASTNGSAPVTPNPAAPFVKASVLRSAVVSDTITQGYGSPLHFRALRTPEQPLDGGVSQAGHI